MIKVILWDVDGTLLDFKAAEKAAIRKCFSIFQLGQCTDDMIKEYSAINDKYWRALEKGTLTKPEVLVGRFQEFFSLHGLPVEKAVPFNEEYQIRLGDTVVFRDDSYELVKSFQGKVLQGVVTNGTKTAQVKKLANSGFDKLIELTFISDEIGIEKPNVGFFDVVFEKLASYGSFKKDEIMIVGDSLTSDMQGGNNAGIVSCWYNPERKLCSLPLRLDHDIENLNQVKDIVG